MAISNGIGMVTSFEIRQPNAAKLLEIQKNVQRLSRKRVLSSERKQQYHKMVRYSLIFTEM